MKFLLTTFMTAIVACSIISCDENNVTGDCEDLVKVEVSLMTDFKDHYVQVEFNEEEHFNGKLSEWYIHGGPSAKFISYLPRGSTTCRVFWETITSPRTNYWDYVDFSLGDLDEYFIRFSVASDSSLVVEVSETKFLYL